MSLRESFIKEVRAYLFEGSTLSQRMNEGQGGEDQTRLVETVDRLIALGLTKENFDEFMDRVFKPKAP